LSLWLNRLNKLAAVFGCCAPLHAGESKTVLFNMCGHGHFDMAAWEKFSAGEIEDFEFPQEAVDEALKSVPGMNGVDFPMPAA
jgi:hypothetical protein